MRTFEDIKNEAKILLGEGTSLLGLRSKDYDRLKEVSRKLYTCKSELKMIVKNPHTETKIYDEAFELLADCDNIAGRLQKRYIDVRRTAEDIFY